MTTLENKRNDIITLAKGAEVDTYTQTFIQGADQRKHQSSASLAFVSGIPRAKGQ